MEQQALMTNITDINKLKENNLVINNGDYFNTRLELLLDKWFLLSFETSEFQWNDFIYSKGTYDIK